jgi:excisionase family DNA binding protein
MTATAALVQPPDSEAYELLDADDVARLLCMKKSWVYAAARERRIPCVRLGRYYRFRRGAIMQWVREQESGATGTVGES